MNGTVRRKTDRGVCEWHCKKKTERQTNIHTERDTDRHTNRQRHRDTQPYTGWL